MSNEITSSIQLRVQNGNFLDAVAVSKQFNQTNQGEAAGTIACVPTASTIAYGGITPGWSYFQNVASGGSNIQLLGTVGTGAAQVFVQLQPQEFNMFRIDPTVTTLSARVNATGGTSLLEYKIFAS